MENLGGEEILGTLGRDPPMLRNGIDLDTAGGETGFFFIFPRSLSSHPIFVPSI
jgi:hypothetical protein